MTQAIDGAVGTAHGRGPGGPARPDGGSRDPRGRA